MAAGQFTLYHRASRYFGRGQVQLLDHPIYVALVTSAYTPDLDDDREWGDIEEHEVSNGNGYAAGGEELIERSVELDGGTDTFSSDPVSWVADDGSITARYAVMYADAGDEFYPLIGYMLLDAEPADVEIADGDTLVLSPHPEDGWFRLTVNPS